MRAEPSGGGRRLRGGVNAWGPRPRGPLPPGGSRRVSGAEPSGGARRFRGGEPFSPPHVAPSRLGEGERRFALGQGAAPPRQEGRPVRVWRVSGAEPCGGARRLYDWAHPAHPAPSPRPVTGSPSWRGTGVARAASGGWLPPSCEGERRLVFWQSAAPHWRVLTVRGPSLGGGSRCPQPSCGGRAAPRLWAERGPSTAGGLPSSRVEGQRR